MHAQRCPVAKLRAATQQSMTKQSQANSRSHPAKRPKTSLLPTLVMGGGQAKKQVRDRREQRGAKSQERPLSFFQNFHGDAAPPLQPRPQMYSENTCTPARLRSFSHTPISTRGPPSTHTLPQSLLSPPTHAAPASLPSHPTHTLSLTSNTPSSHVLLPTHTPLPTHAPLPKCPPLPTHMPIPTRAPPPTHTPQSTRDTPPTHVLSLTRVKSPTNGLTTTRDVQYEVVSKLLRRQSGEEQLIYNENCAVHGHKPASVRLPSLPKSPSCPSTRHSISGERLKNWRRNSLTFTLQGYCDLDLQGHVRDSPRPSPIPLLSPTHIQCTSEQQHWRTLSVGSGRPLAPSTPTAGKSGAVVTANSSRKSQFRWALSLFLIGCDDGPKEKPPPQSIFRQPTRHTYRRGISDLPIECTNRNVGLAY